MARTTSELATQQVGSRYELVLICARRARELNRGWRPKITSNNGSLVTAIREVEQGLIGREYLLKPQTLDRREQPPEPEQ
jgi:DNA-directed RNA polymerase omega subunit